MSGVGADGRATADTVGGAPVRRKKRWWIGVLIAVVVVAVLGVAAELVLRQVIPNRVTEIVREELDLPADAPVDVTLGGSALLNALRGGIGDVTVEIPRAPIVEGVEVDARAHAEFSPFDPEHGSIRGATAELTVPKDQLGAVIKILTSGVADTGEVSNGDLVVGRTIEALGQSLPITARLAFAVNDGDVEVEPRGVAAAGLDLSAEQISRLTGSLLDPVLKPQTVCVRDRLPAGITLTEISLSKAGSVTIGAKLAPDILSNPAMLEPGTCE